MRIKIIPAKIYAALLIMISILALANILGLLHSHFGLFGERSLEQSINLFNMDREGNIPTLFSSLLIFLCFIIIHLIGKSMKESKQPSYGWFLMGWIFLFLSLDEGAQIHELLISVVRSRMETTGIFYFAWMIPYLLLLALFVIVFIPFLKRLPGETRNLFILSGAIFIAGAVGMEMLGGLRAETYGEDIYYGWIATSEETLEMVGMATFCFSLLRFIETRSLSFSFLFGTGTSDEVSQHIEKLELKEVNSLTRNMR
jgi:hypothetical protein